MSLAPTQGSSISQASQKALAALSALSDKEHGKPPDEQQGAILLQNNEEIERLGIWISEHDVSTGRLDHKLREASHLRGRVLSLLTELSSTHTDLHEPSSISQLTFRSRLGSATAPHGKLKSAEHCP
jgi:hypothetical protein